MLLDPGPGKRRLGPEALRTALVDLHDFWLSSHAAAIGLTDRAALVAVGALGRRELAPYSDLDLVLLHDGRKDIDRLAEQLWYPLWNAGIGLDHSVRTPGQAVQVAATDLRAALGLLEARHIAGDAALSDKVRGAVRQAWRAGIRTRFDELADGARERWAKVGDVAHRVEPDLKNGHGGLRDIQLIEALALAQLLGRPGADVLAGARAHPGLPHRAAPAGPPGPGRAARAGRRRGGRRTGDRRTGSSWPGRCPGPRGRWRSPPRWGCARRATRCPDAGWPRCAARRCADRWTSGWWSTPGEVALARDATATRDPALVLRVAATAARTGLPVAAGTLHRLADTAPELREPWPRPALAELLSLLGTGRAMVDVVEALDRTGLWGRLLPEWGAVRDLPPRDRAHVWTVDRHLVEAAAQAARLTTRVARPDLLLVGALLHDIGKGRGGDHSVVGESLAVQIGRRLGLSEPDVALLGAMVRHHLLLPHTATRRDLEDPATVNRVVKTLEGNSLLLDLLEALAEADSLATGPGVWSPWKRTLISDLVRRCRSLMAGEPLPAPCTRSADCAGPGRPRWPRTAGRRSRWPRTPSRPPCWSRCRTGSGRWPRRPGVLALHSLEVHAAELTVADGVAVFSFMVSPALRRAARPGAAAVGPGPGARRHPAAGARRCAARSATTRRWTPTVDRPPPPRVLWFDDEATGAVVVELRGTDRIGLLHQVAAALEGCQVDLRWARVATLGASVVDSFGLAVPGPATGLGPAERRRIEQAMLAAAR